jgi:hypothetical protein
MLKNTNGVSEEQLTSRRESEIKLDERNAKSNYKLRRTKCNT